MAPSRALVMLLAITLAACKPPERPKIQLGAILSTTGALASVGYQQLQAALLAVDQVNAAGGVLGQELELVHKDDGTEEDRGGPAAQALADLHVPVVFGAAGSAISLKASEVLVPANIVLISASSTTPLLSTASDDGLVFRTCPSDALQGKLLAKRARMLGHSRVALVYLPGAYGEGLASAFSQAFVAAGGQAPAFNQQYTTGQSSYTTLLRDLYQAYATPPDAVVLVAYPLDGAQIVNDYNRSFSDKQSFWFFTDATEDVAFVSAVTGSGFSFNHEGTGPGTPSGASYDAFRDAYHAQFGEWPQAGSFAVNAYDAVFLVALAMEAGGASTSAAVKAQLTGVSRGGTAYGPSQYAQAVQALHEGKDINFDGASGVVDFDDAGDVVAPYHLWRVESGALRVTVQSADP